MENEGAPASWGDPYIGLRFLALEGLKTTYKAMENAKVWSRMRLIGGGAPGVFDDIAAFLNTLRTYLDPWYLFQRLKWAALDPIVAWLKGNIYDPLKNHLTALKDSFLGWWAGAMNLLRTTLAAIPDRIYNALMGLPNLLGNIFRPIFEGFKGALSNDLALLRNIVNMIPEPIRAVVREAWQQITSSFRLLWEVFGGYFNTLRTSFVASWTSLGNFIHDPLEGIRKAFNAFSEAFQARIQAPIMAGLLFLWNSVVTGLQRWWAGIQPQIIEAANRAIAIARPVVEQWVGEFKTIPATFLNWVAQTAGTDLALNPSRALVTVGSLYAMSIAAGSLAMTTATALNLIPATNWVGASQLSAFVAEAAGFDPLTRATYGVLLQECLSWPLRYHWNMQLRPKLPTEGEIFIMGRKHGIDYGQFKQAMAMQGIPDTWIDLMYDFFWTDPSPMWLLRMTEGGIPSLKDPGRKREWLDKWLPGWQNDPLAWLKMKLMLAGYEDIDIAPMIEGMQRRSLTSPVTQLKTSVRGMLREAYWTPDQGEAVLAPFEVRPEEFRLLVVAEDISYLNKYLDEQVKAFTDAFYKDVITEEELRLSLSTIFVKPERVEQVISREKLRKYPKPKPPAAPKEDPAVTRLRSEWVQAHIAMFRKRVIGIENLYGYLLADGLSEALTRATVVKEAASRIKAPPLDSPYFLSKSLQLLVKEELADYDDAYMDGTITLGEYLAALRAMGLDDDTATYLADVARLRRFLETLPS